MGSYILNKYLAKQLDFIAYNFKLLPESPHEESFFQTVQVATTGENNNDFVLVQHP